MPRRRDLLLASLAAVGGLPPLHAADLPNFPRPAFDAHTLAQLRQALGLPAPTASADVTLQVPELFEDGTVVPVTLGCALPGVRRLLLAVERNPTYLSAIFEPGAGLEANLSVRLKMQETSNVVVLAQLADGRLLMAQKEVKITLGGCGGQAEPEPERPPQPTLIRVQAAGAAATVRSLMKHEMESGQRKDGSGRTIPAWHIQEVVARVNGQPVLTAQWGTAVSKNPFLQFGVRGVKTGDKVALAWADNHGQRRSDEVTVA